MRSIPGTAPPNTPPHALARLLHLRVWDSRATIWRVRASASDAFFDVVFHCLVHLPALVPNRVSVFISDSPKVVLQFKQPLFSTVRVIFRFRHFHRLIQFFVRLPSLPSDIFPICKNTIFWYFQTMGDSFTKVPLIQCEKLTGTTNYNIWASVVKMRFHGQWFEDHLTTNMNVVAADELTKWK